jgi:hypothetical protein
MLFIIAFSQGVVHAASVFLRTFEDPFPAVKLFFPLPDALRWFALPNQ